MPAIVALLEGVRVLGRMKLKGFVFISLLLPLFVASCGPSEREAKQQAREAVEKLELAVFENPPAASVEIERRLRERLAVQGGVAIFLDDVLGELVTHIIPVQTPWSMSCGMEGLSISIGSYGEDAPRINLVKHDVTLPAEVRRQVGPIAAYHLRSRLAGH